MKLEPVAYHDFSGAPLYAIPEGYKLVPAEPTEAMIDAGAKAISESQKFGTFTCIGHDALDCYKAMIEGEQ